MLNELLKIGDEVVITVDKEDRESGYHPCPDGTKAKILDFAEIYYGRINNFGHKPGVYVNRAWAKVQLPNGNEHLELGGRFTLVNTAEYERRLALFRKLRQEQSDNLDRGVS